MANPVAVKAGPGTLYAAPLGTTEPTSISGAWPTGWRNLGYTDNGSSFSLNIATGPLEVEEENYPLKNITTGITATLAFALAEMTATNLMLVLNTNAANSQTTLADGTLKVDPAQIGSEVRVMLGWDALSSTGAAGTDPFSRILFRQAFQTGTITIDARKGNSKRMYTATFSAEKPVGLQPFSIYFPPSLST